MIVTKTRLLLPGPGKGYVILPDKNLLPKMSYYPVKFSRKKRELFATPISGLRLRAYGSNPVENGGSEKSTSGVRLECVILPGKNMVKTMH